MFGKCLPARLGVLAFPEGSEQESWDVVAHALEVVVAALALAGLALPVSIAAAFPIRLAATLSGPAIPVPPTFAVASARTLRLGVVLSAGGRLRHDLESFKSDDRNSDVFCLNGCWRSWCF
jgi:hypothetical protein